MRVKTDARRREIVRVATALFLELGFERTSMALVAQRLGGSKGTLYGYFTSKEELLLAVLEANLEDVSGHVLGVPRTDGLRPWLTQVGVRLLTARLSGGPARFFRILASLPEESPIARSFFDRSVRPAYQRLAESFAAEIARGTLRAADPWTMVVQFKGLLDGDLFERVVLAPDLAPDAEETARLAADAVDTFLRAFGTERAEELAWA